MLKAALALTLALRLLVNYPLHSVIHADLSPKGSLLATSHSGNYLEIRSLKPLYLDGRLFSPERSEIEKVSFLNENTLLVVRKDKVEIWKRQSIASWRLSVDLKKTGPIAVSKDCKLLAYTPSEDRISIFSTVDRSQVSAVNDLPDLVKALSFSQDNSALFVLFSDGELISYDVASGKIVSEIGRLNGDPLLHGGRAFITKGRSLRILNLGDLSTLHVIKIKKKIQKALVKDKDILLISKGKGYLFKLKEGKYFLEKEIEGIEGKKIKLTDKGILIWDERHIGVEGLFNIKVSKIPVPEKIALIGNRLAETGQDFALVWNLETFSPEFFYRGESTLIGNKLYLKTRNGYVCYDLKRGESHLLKTDGQIIEGNELFLWKTPYLTWKDNKIKLERPPRWAKILPKENILITDVGLYDLKTKEKLLDLRGKNFFISKILKSLVILRKGGIIIYRLGSRIARGIDIEYSKAFINEEGSKLALVPPYDYGLTILDLQNGEETEIEDENIGKVKGALYVESKLIVWGKNGFSVYDADEKKTLFEGMSGIEKIIKGENNRIIIIREDGTLWLYSIERKRPVLYHDLNGIAKTAMNLPKAMITVLESGEVLILSKRNLIPWFCFIFTSMRDWLVLSSENYFNASPLGKKRIVWLKGRYIYPGRLAFEKYMNPKKLRGIWNEL